MTPQLLARLVAARRGGPAAVLVTRLPDGAQWIFPDPGLPPGVASAAERALARGQTGTVEIEGAEWFLHVQEPPPRLIVVGAVHITQALAPMASLLGIAVTVIDPRPAFNSAERMGAGVTRLLDWPEAVLDALAIDAQTAVVVLAHDPKLDDPALDHALRSPAGYIGALGSRKSHANRLARMAALGHGAAALARIRGPVGLALGALTAPEIALSILAEMVAVRRGAALGQRPTSALGQRPTSALDQRPTSALGQRPTSAPRPAADL
jgi:xanthine dehydrogenase accessory factor